MYECQLQSCNVFIGLSIGLHEKIIGGGHPFYGKIWRIGLLTHPLWKRRFWIYCARSAADI